MEISGIFSALVVGLIIGLLGRLVLPGRQRIGFLITILTGIIAALLGTFVAGLVDVDETAGIDWIELALQVAFAALGIALVHAARGRRAITR